MTEQNSLATGLGALGRSKRVRAFLIAAWPYILPLVTLAAGWLMRSALLEPRVAVVEAKYSAIDKRLEAIEVSMLALTVGEQQKLLTVGRQAAYATAGFEAYETPKRQESKRAYAEKYASAYERMVRGGKSPEEALVALWAKVAVP